MVELPSPRRLFVLARRSGDGIVAIGIGSKSSSRSSTLTKGCAGSEGSSSLGWGYEGTGSIRFFLLCCVFKRGDDRCGSILSAIMYKKRLVSAFKTKDDRECNEITIACTGCKQQN